MNLDIDASAKIIREFKPELVLFGGSVFLFPHPVKDSTSEPVQVQLKGAEPVRFYGTWEPSEKETQNASGPRRDFPGRIGMKCCGYFGRSSQINED